MIRIERISAERRIDEPMGELLRVRRGRNQTGREECRSHSALQVPDSPTRIVSHFDLSLHLRAKRHWLSPMPNSTYIVKLFASANRPAEIARSSATR